MAALLVAMVGGTACAEDMWRPRLMFGDDIKSPSLRARIQRHWTYLNSGVPPEFRGARPDAPIPPEGIVEGRDLYRRHCADCHRMDGMGGGEAALGLSPSPALLAHLIKRPEAVDEYLLWSISDGGRLFGSDMPAFGGVLSRDEIWKIIAFMRSDFEAPGPLP